MCANVRGAMRAMRHNPSTGAASASAMDRNMTAAPLYSPDPIPFEPFDDAERAVERLLEIYARNTGFLRDAFQEVLQGKDLSLIHI